MRNELGTRRFALFVLLACFVIAGGACLAPPPADDGSQSPRHLQPSEPNGGTFNFASPPAPTLERRALSTDQAVPVAAFRWMPKTVDWQHEPLLRPMNTPWLGHAVIADDGERALEVLDTRIELRDSIEGISLWSRDLHSNGGTAVIDSGEVLVASARTLHTLSLADGRTIATKPLPEAAAHGRLLAADDVHLVLELPEKRSVVVLSRDDLSPVWTLASLRGELRDVDLVGDRLMVCHGSSLTRFDLVRGRQVTQSDHRWGSFAVDRNNDRVLIGRRDGVLQVVAVGGTALTTTHELDLGTGSMIHDVVPLISNQVAFASSEPWLGIVELESAELVAKLESGRSVTLASSANGRWLASAPAQGRLVVWDAGALEPQQIRPTLMGGVSDVAIDTHAIAVAGEEGSLMVFDAVDGHLLHHIFGRVSSIADVSLFTNGSTPMIAFAGDSRVEVLTVADADEVVVMNDLDGIVRFISPSPDGAKLVVGVDGQRPQSSYAMVVDLGDGRSERVQADWVDITWSPDGSLLVGSGVSGTTDVVDADSLTTFAQVASSPLASWNRGFIDGHGELVIAQVGGDQQIAESDGLPYRYLRADGPLVLTATGDRAAAIRGDGSLDIFDVATELPLLRIDPRTYDGFGWDEPDWPLAMAFDQTGRRIAVCRESGECDVRGLPRTAVIAMGE